MDAASIRLGVVLASELCLATLLVAAPVGWRADGNGNYADAKPPTEWADDKKNVKNITWKTKLPGHSFGSPVVVGERVYVVSDPAELLSINLTDGAIVWTRSHHVADAIGAEAAEKATAKYKRLDEQRRRLHQERDKAKDDAEKKAELKKQIDEVEKEYRDLKAKYPPPPHRGGGGNSAATPICDGKHVYAVFGNGIVSAHTTAGERLWIKYLPAAEMGFGQTSSPLLIDGKLIVHLDGMTALDAKTGAEQWRLPASSQHASPIALKVGDTWAVLSPAGLLVRAADGKVLLKENQLSSSECTPIHHNGILYLLHGGARALRLVPAGDDVAKIEKLWEAKLAGGRRTPSAVMHNGLLYAATTEGMLDVIDTMTGERLYTQRANLGNVYSSVTAAGDHIFLGGTGGTMLVLAAGRTYREIARNKLEGFGTCPVFSGDKMILRTDRHLYCVGK